MPTVIFPKPMRHTLALPRLVAPHWQRAVQSWDLKALSRWPEVADDRFCAVAMMHVEVHDGHVATRLASRALDHVLVVVLRIGRPYCHVVQQTEPKAHHLFRVRDSTIVDPFSATQRLPKVRCGGREDGWRRKPSDISS